MFIPLLLFILGFFLLLKGADILTDAGSAIARKLRVSEFIIGVVIIGIGTSIPELVVTLFSVLENNALIGIGTIVGSNTFNILFILGISALIAPLALTKKQVWHHLPLNIFAVVIVALVVRFGASLDSGVIGISRLEGFFLLILFFIWICYLYFLYLINEGAPKKNLPEAPVHSHHRFSLPILIIAGLLGIIIGGEWVTQGAVAMAEFFGVKKAVIGLTAVGIGTSLPELFASLVAAYKRNYGLAVGNIIGSNIFDFLMIFGVAAAMKGIAFTEFLVADMWVTILAAVLLFIAVFIGQKYVLKKWQGAIFVLLYILYAVYIVLIRP